MPRTVKDPKERVEVCLIEHNPLAARFLQRLLKSRREVECFFCDGLPELQLLSNRAASPVIVIDEGTLPRPLTAFVSTLRVRVSGSKILVVGPPDPIERLCRFVSLGIEGFIPYNKIEAQIIPAIRAINDGHLWFSSGVLEQFARKSKLSRRGSRNVIDFTQRERLIATLIQQRLSNKEIAATVGITERTVKFHLGNIFIKLGVHDRLSALTAITLNQSELLHEGLKQKPAGSEPTLIRNAQVFDLNSHP